MIFLSVTQTRQRIKDHLTGNPVLQACGVNSPYTVNVLADPDIREGIKQYANWPTIPQLYVNGEFVGGSDILKEMYQSGELQKLLEGLRQQT